MMGSPTKAIECLPLSLESIHDIERCDGLALGVLTIGDRVLDHRLEEVLQDISRFLVDQRRYTFDTASAGQAADGWLGDPENRLSDCLLGVTLGPDFSVALAALALTFSCCSCRQRFARLYSSKQGRHE